MTLPEMIRRLVDIGASAEAVAIAVEGYESVSALSAECLRTLSDTTADRRRKKDRLRKKLMRKKIKETSGLAKANDVANKHGSRSDVLPDLSADASLPSCNNINSFLLPSSLDSNRGNREEGSKGRVNTRAKGKRIDPNSELSAEDRQFAISHGLSNPDRAWAEFIDYWIGIPGQRGTKLDWSATWRNRVRTLTGNGGANVKRANGSSSSERGSGASFFAAMAGYGTHERGGAKARSEHVGPTIELSAKTMATNEDTKVSRQDRGET